jgi:tetratricopeptide (TPR) repeat protein
MTLNPSYARGWFLSGVLRVHAGQPDLAIEHVETSLRLSPRQRMGTPLSSMGLAYFFKRQFGEAASKLLQHIQENPGFPGSYRTLAACYAHMGRLDEARATIARLRVITKRSAVSQPRGPRALPVGPAPRNGRGDMSQSPVGQAHVPSDGRCCRPPSPPHRRAGTGAGGPADPPTQPLTTPR